MGRKISLFSSKLSKLIHGDYYQKNTNFSNYKQHHLNINDIEVLEQVQRRFSKMVLELKSKPYLERKEALD
ncbi:hypothetical protein BpHYR1_050237 [Brachionus plicatilis]|uniref:Uncharacterized protein n=1 Tax=Brachionus plicatilis TaxID=10195 RepID=A0A3M7RJH4_BRAPC|nr:hypothetical protein BpHYR1_050237 [Brachionus plicatilis]